MNYLAVYFKSFCADIKSVININKEKIIDYLK